MGWRLHAGDGAGTPRIAEIRKERFPRLSLWLAGDAAAEAVRAWVASGAWRAPSALPGAAALSTRNRKNEVWAIDVPGAGPCVLKLSRVPPDAPAGKRLECAFRLRFRRRGLRAMRMAMRAAAAGVPTFSPLAFWVEPGPPLLNGLLYRRIEGESLKALWRNDPGDHGGARPGEPENPRFLALLPQAGAAAARLHAVGIAHDDLLPRNFVVRPSGSLALVDMESARPLRIPRVFAAARRREALRSLHRLRDRALYDRESLDAFFSGYRNP